MVKVCRSTAELTQERQKTLDKIGFVPTMGNLHTGHISLLERALGEFSVVYFSIFVNPKQFGPKEDFNRYPRTLEQDIALIESCLKGHPGKSVVVYAPADPKEVFPPGHDLNISVMALSSILEGKIRPGHFEGVATVVHRLFEIIRPTRAYFGLKDYQQFLVIKQMVKDLILPVEVVGMPIIRESSGLALSSRNQYLSPEQKEASLILNQSLKRVQATLAGQRKNLPEAAREIKNLLKDTNWNYLELRDAESLSEDVSHSEKVVLLGVYQLGTTRLLDNTVMELK